MKFRKKPIVIEATQWFKNGDHPDDYPGGSEPARKLAREHEWEGAIVHYFRRPDIPDDQACQHCQQIMRIHGWINTKEGGHIVCPGDWIITGVQGERYPCKPDIFAATYDEVTSEYQS